MREYPACVANVRVARHRPGLATVYRPAESAAAVDVVKDMAVGGADGKALDLQERLAVGQREPGIRRIGIDRVKPPDSAVRGGGIDAIVIGRINRQIHEATTEIH